MFFRYLTTGDSFKSLSFQFYRGYTTVGRIVRETCDAIWKGLQPLFMPTPDEERTFSGIMNCEIYQIDGKHIRVNKFANSGSSNFNYKGFFLLY